MMVGIFTLTQSNKLLSSKYCKMKNTIQHEEKHIINSSSTLPVVLIILVVTHKMSWEKLQSKLQLIDAVELTQL